MRWKCQSKLTYKRVERPSHDGRFSVVRMSSQLADRTTAPDPFRTLTSIDEHWKFMDSLTIEEAYLAMFAFIEKRYRLTSSDDLAVLLSDMSLNFPGGTADPALQDDWEEAVELVRSGKVDAMQRLKRS